jgi:hypothetical protein
MQRQPLTHISLTTVDEEASGAQFYLRTSSINPAKDKHHGFDLIHN